MIMKKILFIIIMAAIFSCDKYEKYNLYIDNQTNETIKISFSGNSPYTNLNPENLFFHPLQQKLLYEEEGDAMKDGCYTGIKEDEVTIYSTSGKTVRKEIWDVNNWICNGSFEDGWEMIFVITENDLE